MAPVEHPSVVRARPVIVLSGAIAMAAGWTSWRYPPDYIPLNRITGTGLLIGGLLAALSGLLRVRRLPHDIALAASGSIIVGSCAIRAVDIWIDVGPGSVGRALIPGAYSGPTIDISFVMAGYQWTALALAALAIWRWAAHQVPLEDAR